METELRSASSRRLLQKVSWHIISVPDWYATGLASFFGDEWSSDSDRRSIQPRAPLSGVGKLYSDWDFETRRFSQKGTKVTKELRIRAWRSRLASPPTLPDSETKLCPYNWSKGL